MARHIRKNDIVVVIAGDHNGARGKVLHIDPRQESVIVEGINMVFRHVRPSRKNPQGGRVQKEAPIHISNVLPYDSGKGRGLRSHFEVEKNEDGRVISKRRINVAGTTLHTLSRKDRSEG